MTAILLDISRTVARARLPAPTGIDRVERAYIRWALKRPSLFLAGFDGDQHVVGHETVRALIDWLDGAAAAPSVDLKSHLRPQRDARLRRAQSLIRRGATARRKTMDLRARDLGGANLYLNVGHDNLDWESRSTLASAGLRTAVLVHDTIPLDYPQFARDGAKDRFDRFLSAVAGADVVLANSQDTARHLRNRLEGIAPTVAPLGIEQPGVAGPRAGPPSFLVLGTIEPRKNHALLMDVWEQFGAGTGRRHLRIIGRRGWKNTDVFQRLDSGPMMGRTIHELGTLDDDALAVELASARAVLFPSFMEGYGLPLGEALSVGTPVIASDLPALREVGGGVPEWLAPDDVAGWKRTINAYSTDPSPERDAQIARLKSWSAPTWEEHFRIVEAKLWPGAG